MTDIALARYLRLAREYHAIEAAAGPSAPFDDGADDILEQLNEIWQTLGQDERRIAEQRCPMRFAYMP